jgi:hypothetical protein
MRQGNNNNRQRSRGRSGRSKNQGGQSNPNRAYDSSGPTGRLRGTATQLAEKYATLAGDARSNKDRVVVEGLLQHAEHYQRLVSDANEAQDKLREQSETNRRQNNDQSADSKEDSPQVNGSDAVVEKAVDLSVEQPDIAAAGAGDQPGVDDGVPVQETPTPVRRQRRSTGQRRSRAAAKPEENAEEPAKEAKAAKADKAPAKAAETETDAEAPSAAEPSE